MKRYVIVEDEEEINGEVFPIFNVMKETLIFGFSFCGEFLNKEPFTDIKEAEKFLEEKLARLKNNV